MANYTAYIPAVGSTTYPTQLSNFITLSEAIDTEVENARNGEANLLAGINLKLSLTGGTLTGALILSTGNLTLSAGNIVVSGTVDGRDIATDGTRLDSISPNVDSLVLPASTTISTFGASLVDGATAAAALTTLGLDTDLATISLPASTTISTFGASLINDANAAIARTTLGAQVAGTYNTIIGTDTDINTSGSTIVDSITVTDGVITSMGTRVLTIANLGITATAAEVSYTTDVTSNIQEQLNTKAALASPVFTGNPTAPTPATIDNDTSIATTEFVKNASLGIGQTWQDLFASRTMGTTYYNTTDAPIEVSVRIVTDVATGQYINITVDGSIRASNSMEGVSGFPLSASIIVPVGSSYSAATTATYNAWHELR